MTTEKEKFNNWIEESLKHAIIQTWPNRYLYAHKSLEGLITDENAAKFKKICYLNAIKDGEAYISQSSIWL